MNEIEAKRCLNCGTELQGRFCHNCGQNASTPERVDGRAFWGAFSSSFSRMSSSFFLTCGTLMTRPWKVIQAYIHGNRVKYVQPFAMTLQLIVLEAALELVLGNLVGDPTLFKDEKTADIHWLLATILDSQFVMTFIAAIPLVLLAYLYFMPFGSRRFSLYEYMTGIFYLSCAIMLYYNLATILAVAINPKHLFVITTLVVVAAGLFFGVYIMRRCFPVKNRFLGAIVYLFFIVLIMGYCICLGLLIPDVGGGS